MRRILLSSLVGFGAGMLVMNLWPEVRTTAELPPMRTALAANHGPEEIADLVERVGPSVVNIDTLSRRPNPMRRMPFFMLDSGEGMAPFVEQKGVGSGFVIGSDGKILTNDHVVRGATRLTVTLPDGRKLPGKVLGTDPGQDIALVTIAARSLPTLSLASSAKVRVGSRVVAIGSPLGLDHSVTAGIVSAQHRGIDINDRVDFIQTDASINPGNSGGPLLNMGGEVIGMNTAVVNGAQGIGFAIPADTLRTAARELETRGKIGRPWMGVQLTDAVPGRGPAVVGGVVAGSPADKVGIEPGDIIERIEDQAITNSRDVIRTVGRRAVGDTLKLHVRRGGEAMTFSIPLQEMPDSAG